MSRGRNIVAASLAALFAGLLVFAASALPEFGNYRGPYGDLINQRVEGERHCPQGVAAVTFDYRGFDTLGEEFILFAAVTGVLLLMRRQKGEGEVQPRDAAEGRPLLPVNDGVVLAGTLLFPVAFVLGTYVILHGHLSPGGGFQGGVLVASSFLFIYLSGEYGDFSPYAEKSVVEVLEGAGAGGYVIVALWGLVAGQTLMANVLPLGSNGKLLSAGTLPILNCTVGVEVAAGFMLVLAAFLGQALLVRRRGK